MSRASNKIGQCLGNYRIIADIGSGGFGNVYQGQHTILTERLVAIKQLHAHLGSSEERERFLEEARLLERLKHPNILHIFDVGIDEGFPYIVAEYTPNGSLRNRLKQYATNPISIEEALTILSQIGQGLSYAHQQNIIHRDMKPENILFNSQGKALIADFGIATTLSTTSIKYVTVVGTPSYMAPEQFRGSASKESDQYALGCIAYELFTGQTPFTATDFFTMGFQHLTKEPVAPTQVNPDLPVYIEQAILKAMAKQRTSRHININAFISALHASTSSQVLILTLPNASIPTESNISTTPYLSEALVLDQRNSFSIYQPGTEQIVDENTSNRTLPILEPEELGNIYNPDKLDYQGPTTPLPPSISVPPSVEHPVHSLLKETGDDLQSSSLITNEATKPISPSNLEDGPHLPFNVPQTQYVNKKQVPIFTSTSFGANGRAMDGAIEGREVTLPLRTSRDSNRHNRVKRGSSRRWVILTIICIVTAVAIIGVFLFTLPPMLSQITKTKISAPTAFATAPQTPLARSKLPPTSKRAPTPKPKSTPTLRPTSTSAVHTPTAAPAPTPTPTPGPTSTPTPENLIAPFTSLDVATINSYQGTVTITVSGTGEASQTQQSDAFYIFTDNAGNLITPVHARCWVLNINNQPTDNFISPIPAYNATHVYTFNITAPGGQLNFDVCDNNHTDNSGAYNITVTQQGNSSAQLESPTSGTLDIVLPRRSIIFEIA